MHLNFFKNFKTIFLLINYIFVLNFFNALPNKASEITQIDLIEYTKGKNKNNFYILGPGDTIFLKVSENTSDLNQTFTINGEGISKLKRINDLYISGLTIKELKKVLNEKYLDYVKNPNVELSVLNYRPIQIFVKGEVIDPGMHSLPGAFKVSSYLNKYNNSILGNFQNEFNSQQQNTAPVTKQFIFPTVYDALRESGGITNFADLENIVITRRNNISEGGGRITTVLNLSDSITLKDTSNNIRILDGDTLEIRKSNKPLSSNTKTLLKSNINPRFLKIFIGGRVPLVGERTIRKNTSLVEAVESSGGTKVIKGPVRFFRYSAEGGLEKRKFRYRKSASKGAYNNPYLRDGDIIIVGQSGLNIATEVLNEISSPLQGFVTSYGLYKALTD